nr:PREDICTED: D-arabinitol dehydrogenase 1-like isoform X1 [Megachile rotundata]XP_012152433.1 PREDICTED: D-arabinitol dehydrogenase 1-like isoform X2 [Megachile rotundata]
MESLSFDVTKKTLALTRAELPVPAANEVRIRVAYSGICGTDLHILDGSFPCKRSGLLTLGHEFSGTVDAVGSSVKSLKVGQKVVVDPNSGCNTCDYCHGGNYHFCDAGGINNTVGIYRDGGWSTHAVVPENQVHVLPDGIQMHQAALTEPLSCLAHGWDKINPVHVGLNVLVIGAGIIGLLWSCLLHLHGLRKTVTVSEPQEKRRNMVTKLDLDYEVKNPKEVKEGFDLVVDCSGSGPAMEAAVPLLRRGGRLCVFGVASPNAKLTIEPFQVYMKELNIIGVNINPFTFPKGLALLKAMGDRYLNYEKLGIKVYLLSQYREALEALKRGDISKAVFKLE